MRITPLLLATLALTEASSGFAWYPTEEQLALIQKFQSATETSPESVVTSEQKEESGESLTSTGPNITGSLKVAAFNALDKCKQLRPKMTTRNVVIGVTATTVLAVGVACYCFPEGEIAKLANSGYELAASTTTACSEYCAKLLSESTKLLSKTFGDGQDVGICPVGEDGMCELGETGTCGMGETGTCPLEGAETGGVPVGVPVDVPVPVLVPVEGQVEVPVEGQVEGPVVEQVEGPVVEQVETGEVPIGGQVDGQVVEQVAENGEGQAITPAEDQVMPSAGGPTCPAPTAAELAGGQCAVETGTGEVPVVVPGEEQVVVPVGEQVVVPVGEQVVAPGEGQATGQATEQAAEQEASPSWWPFNWP
jgi:hypothetical protein